jgi:hypothetical protein
MLLEFDIEKTIAAIGFLMSRENGELDMFLSLKMLYLADKQALINWGKPITGDSFVSMPKGPVLSETYNLFKGTNWNHEYQKRWNEFISEKVSHCIYLLKEPDLGLLSEREIEVLEEARNLIHQMVPWTVAKWLHDTCPEWKDPQGSSIPIDPSVILRNAGRSEDDILLIEESNEAARFAKLLLTGR